MTEATTAYEIIARVGDDDNVVITEHIPTVADVCRLLKTDVSRTKPIIKGRVANPLTRLVPNVVVEFC